MKPYWNLFYDTGDPLVWLLYRSEQALAAETSKPESDSEAKEATPWQPPPIS